MTEPVATFFYGLYMDADVLREQGATPRNPRVGFVEGFQLRIGARAFLIQAPGKCAYGVLMDLSHGDLDTLYTPPAVAAYRPEPVLVQLNEGGTQPALCFNLPEPDLSAPPDPHYVERLAEILRKVGIPDDVAGLPATGG